MFITELRTWLFRDPRVKFLNLFSAFRRIFDSQKNSNIGYLFVIWSL